MAQRRKSMNKSRGRRMSRGQSRGRRMRGGGVFDFLSSTDQVKASLDANGNPIENTDLANQGTEAVKNLTGQATNSLTNGLTNAEAGLSGSIDKGTAEAGKLFGSFFGTNDPPGAPVAPVDTVNQSQGPPINQSQGPPIGGRRSSKSRSMRMKGGLNPAFGYYAAPVTDSVTAQPTYMMKSTGGKRRRSCRRKSCRRKRSCKRRTCKRRRSKRH